SVVEANESPERAGSTKDEVAGRFPRNEHVRAPDEWGSVFPDPRLVAAIVDRITFNAHILETGTQSYRLRASKTATRRRRSG
nr:ATP-binding protein [Mycobacterium sp.]